MIGECLPPPPPGRIWALIQNVNGRPCPECDHVFPFFTIGGDDDGCAHRYAAFAIAPESLGTVIGPPYIALTPALLALLDIPPMPYRDEEG